MSAGEKATVLARVETMVGRKRQAKALLAKAKRAVELAIEQGEKQAIALLQQQNGCI
jgi:hypothetical protein